MSVPTPIALTPISLCTGWRRFDALCVATVAMFGAWPLCGVVASMDWAQHVAIVDILARLWRGDAGIAAHYGWQLQPVAYHLLYVLWTPLAVVLGTQASATAMLFCLYTGHFAAMSVCLRRMRGPQILTLSALPLFYGVNFIWGFAPTMMGMPLMLIALTWLATGAMTRRAAVAAALCAALATASHIVFWPAICAACAVACIVHGRASWRPSAAVLGSSSLVAGPGLWHVVRQRGAVGAHTDSTFVVFEGLVSGLRHIGMALRPVDRSWHQAGHVLCLLVLLVATGWPNPHRHSARKAIAALALMLVSLVWVIPVVMEGAGGMSWLLNMRMLDLAIALVTLLAATSTVWSGPYAGTSRGVWLLCACSMVVGVVQVTHAFRTEVEPFVQAAAQHNLEGRLCVHVTPEQFGRAWPPLTRHMAALVFARRLDWQADLFVGGHLPIYERASGNGPRARAASVAWLSAWQEDRDSKTKHMATQILWQFCDAMLVQGENTALWAATPDDAANVLMRTRHAVLFGKPLTSLGSGSD